MQATNKAEIEELKQKFNSQSYCKFLGIQIVDLRKGAARLCMHLNQKDSFTLFHVVHGGIISTLADSAIAAALLSVVGLETPIVSIESKINYLRPVKSNELFAKAKIIYKGSKIAVGDVEVKAEGKIVAKCSATFMILEQKK